MKPTLWIPALAFLVVSIPVVLLLQAQDWGGEFRLLIAMGAGALASMAAQSLLRSKKEDQP